MGRVGPTRLHVPSPGADAAPIPLTLPPTAPCGPAAGPKRHRELVRARAEPADAPTGPPTLGLMARYLAEAEAEACAERG